MAFPTKVQLIKRKASEQWYINFPSALAQAMEFSRGETVEWLVEDKALLALRRPEVPPHRAKKTPSGILAHFDQLWQQCAPAFQQQRVAEHAQVLALSSLLCLGRHSITGLLSTSGAQFQDWTAAYRLFSRDRLPIDSIFAVTRRAICSQLPGGAPFQAFLDDTLVRRCGLHTPGVAWRRDPLGPHFHTNFVRAQRFLQVSAAMADTAGSHRLAPIGFTHAPTPAKPKKNATNDELQQYRIAALNARLSVRAVEQMVQLRQSLDLDPGGAQRLLLVAFDGGYTNSTVLKQIPERTVCIGRLRKDAKLYFPAAAPTKTRGRKARYGQLALTPEQLKDDETQPWQTMTLDHSGIKHALRFKVCRNVLWRTTGVQKRHVIVVIAPLAYRLRKGSKLLYRKPAYLVCADSDLDSRQIIETYFQRWEIEVNFREEKTLLGVGQAQVRNGVSIEAVPALTVAAYSLMLLAAQCAYGGSGSAALLPLPKWSARNHSDRTTTQQLIHQLRAEVWGKGLGVDNFPLTSALFYANG